eukprot:403347867
MGNSLCCTNSIGLGPHDIDDDIIPIEINIRKKFSTIGGSHQNLLLNENQAQLYNMQQSQNPQKQLNKSKSTNRIIRNQQRIQQLVHRGEQPNTEFEINQTFPIKYLSFSQRKYLGFRNKFEFDKKRLILGSTTEYSVFGYDHEKRVYELYAYQTKESDHEEIRHISFLEDHIPTFIFKITYKKDEGKSYFKILKLRKNKKYTDKQLQDNQNQELSRSILKEDMKQQYEKGNFKERRKKSYDNVELIPKDHILKQQQQDQAQRNSGGISFNKNSDQKLLKKKGSQMNLQTSRSHNHNNLNILETIQSFENQNQREFDTNEQTVGRQSIGNGIKTMFTNIFTKKQTQKERLILSDQVELNNDFEVDDLDKTEEQIYHSSNNKILSPIKENPFDLLSSPEKNNEEIQYPFVTEEFGKLQLRENVLKAQLFNNPSGTYLFTIEEGQKLSIYIIKGYISPQNVKNRNHNGQNLSFKSSNITNFKMAKRATLELEYMPKQIEFYGDFFAIIYKENTQSRQSTVSSTIKYTSFIDIVEKSGKPVSRIDLQKILLSHGLNLLTIKRIKFPRLQWSDRKIEEYDLTKATVLKKAIIVGDCMHDEKKRPFILKINLETQQPEVIKVLRMDDSISEVAYGPYDNGYFMVGLTSGQLLIFDIISLDRIHMVQLFQSQITRITFEPTNMIFVSSKQGETVAISVIQKEMHYVYLDLGKRQYCTVALPANANRQTKAVEGLNTNTLFCL